MTGGQASAPDEAVLEPLRASRLISSAAVEQARTYQRAHGGFLGDALLRLNLVTEVDFLRTFSALYQTRFVKADKATKVNIVPEALERLQVRTAERMRVLPLLWNKDSGELHLLATIPLPAEIDAVCRSEAKARKVIVYVATPGVIAALIRRWYYGDSGALGEVSENGAGPLLVTPPPRETPEYPTDGKTVVVEVDATQVAPAALPPGSGDLARHLPKAIAAGLAEAQPAPRTADTTVLFVDLKGFTQLADHLPAVEVVRVLNLVFEEMVKIVFEHKGMLDKFIGDRLMALWGVPELPGTDPKASAGRAVRAALAISERIPELETGIAPFKVCVGVHCGDAVAGFIGTELRREFTAIGSTVTIASRLCEMALDNQALTTQAVLSRLEPGVCENSPVMFLNGFGTPLMTYALRRGPGSK